MACGNCGCGRAEAERLFVKAKSEEDKELFSDMAQNSSCKNRPAKSTADTTIKSGGCGSGCACAGN